MTKKLTYCLLLLLSFFKLSALDNRLEFTLLKIQELQEKNDKLIEEGKIDETEYIVDLRGEWWSQTELDKIGDVTKTVVNNNSRELYKNKGITFYVVLSPTMVYSPLMYNASYSSENGNDFIGAWYLNQNGAYELLKGWDDAGNEEGFNEKVASLEERRNKYYKEYTCLLYTSPSPRDA